MSLITFTEEHRVGIDEMDTTHEEFIELVNRLAETDDRRVFAELFQELLTHTEQHFAREEELMETCGFPAIAEHKGEHARVLAQMRRFNDKAQGGIPEFATSFIKEAVPSWFMLHARTMDSALAHHLKSTGAT